MVAYRRDRGVADPYAEDSAITKRLAELASRADVVMETQRIIANIEGELAAERKGLEDEMKRFNEAREKVVELCPEVATGFLAIDETMKVVDGKLQIVKTKP